MLLREMPSAIKRHCDLLSQLSEAGQAKVFEYAEMVSQAESTAKRKVAGKAGKGA